MPDSPFKLTGAAVCGPETGFGEVSAGSIPTSRHLGTDPTLSLYPGFLVN
jgi:hypothetical protein